MLYSVIQAVGTIFVALGGVFIGKTKLRRCGWAILGTGIVVYLLTSILSAVDQERKSVLLHTYTQRIELLNARVSELIDTLYDVAYARPTIEVRKTGKRELKLSIDRTKRKNDFGIDGMNATPSISRRLTILSPSNNDTVSYRGSAQGVVSDPMAKVWLIIHPMDVSTYWVQPSITVNKDGSWKSVAYFGRTADVGKRFEVLAIANPKRELREADTLNGWPEAQWTSKVVEVFRK